MKTDCSNCGTPMPSTSPVKGGIFSGSRVTVTAYRCKKCGHWNDLKKRKGYAEYRESLKAAK